MYRIIFGEIFREETTSFDAEAMTPTSDSSFSESSSTSSSNSSTSSSSSGSSKSSLAEPTKKKKKSEVAIAPFDSVEREKPVAEETMSDSDVVRKEDEEEEEDSKVPAIIQPGEVGTPRTRRSKKMRIDATEASDEEFSPAERMAMELNPYPKILDTVTTDTDYKCKEPPSIIETRQLLYEKYGVQDADNTFYHVFGKSMCW
jgi:hypothetical protein